MHACPVWVVRKFSFLHGILPILFREDLILLYLMDIEFSFKFSSKS